MSTETTRRELLMLAGLGGVVFASGLSGRLAAGQKDEDDFFFLQLSDTHWGFQGAPNPDAAVTLRKAVATVNSLDVKPDFLVFTGDLTHTTDDPKVRRARMAEFRDIVAALNVKDVRFLPGEHDASLDKGEAYQERFGELRWAFDHKGVHFVGLDNVSDPSGRLGEAQLAWLAADLGRTSSSTPMVVLTHRPLFDLYPSWDWATKDGAEAIRILKRHPNVTVFYGHIHQENHRETDGIYHHSARSLIFPLPSPGSVPKRAPIAWDPEHPYKGLGFRTVAASAKSRDFRATEYPVVRS
ncbi:MAG: metallophosphoesterase [Deltaproteobacteria bacterium]|nr:metallophosphoesterase [Deltaproteobacteria bacterium]